MRIVIKNTREETGKWTADYISGKIKAFNPTPERPFVLGLPTGSSPPSSISSRCCSATPMAATRCGVTGLRPTFGRGSRYGAMALSWSMDKIGKINPPSSKGH